MRPENLAYSVAEPGPTASSATGENTLDLDATGWGRWPLSCNRRLQNRPSPSQSTSGNRPHLDRRLGCYCSTVPGPQIELRVRTCRDQTRRWASRSIFDECSELRVINSRSAANPTSSRAPGVFSIVMPSRFLSSSLSALLILNASVFYVHDKFCQAKKDSAARARRSVKNENFDSLCLSARFLRYAEPSIHLLPQATASRGFRRRLSLCSPPVPQQVKGSPGASAPSPRRKSAGPGRLRAE